MVTVATGPTPPRPSLGDPIGRALGAFGARRMIQADEAERARREAELLSMLVGGGTPAAGGQGATPATRNPFANLMPAPGGTAAGPGAAVSPIAPAAGAAAGAMPAPAGSDRPVDAAPSAAPEDPDAAALSRAPGGVGDLFRQMAPEQRTAAIAALRQGGMGVGEIIELAGGDPVEFGFQNVGGRLVRTRADTGQADVMDLPGARSDPATDVAKLRSDLEAGLITREEFQIQRDRILAGEGQDPMSTDELHASLVQEFRRGEISREEFDQLEAMIRGGGEGSVLSANARTAIMLNRRVRGEQTGTEFDSISPEQAEAVGDLIFSEPGRYRTFLDAFGRLVVEDTQKNTRRLVTDLPGLVDEGAGGAQPGASAQPGTAAQPGAAGTSGTAGAGSDPASVIGGLTTGEGGLGFMGRVQQLGNVLVPQFGGQLSEPERAEIATDLTFLRNRITAALRASGRLLKDERSELAGLVPDPQAFFESTPNALASLLALRGRLEDLRQDAIDTANNETKPANARSDEEILARELGRLQGQLAIPASIFDQADPQQAFTFAQSLTPTSAAMLETDAIDAMVNVLTNEQIDALDARTRRALIQKLQQRGAGRGGG